MPSVKVSSRGQLVIPVEIRRRHKIEPGDTIEFLDFGNQIVMIPIRNAIRDAKGWLHSDQTVLQMLRESRKSEKIAEERKEQEDD